MEPLPVKVYAAVSVVQKPAQITADDAETDATGVGFTVTLDHCTQPAGVVYVISAVPNATPVTVTGVPVPDGTLATVGSLLVHVPPPTLALSVVVEFSHTVNTPAMTGIGSMVITAVPAIALEHKPETLTACTVYVPLIVSKPKFRLEPVPANGPATGILPLYKV